MSSERIDLERLRYWQGQALRSDDLNDDLSYAAQRRWWHNRALHDTFGIAFGLGVTGSHGEDGDPFVLVSPGVAYDAFGRELILEEAEPVALPELRLANGGPEVWTLLAHLPAARGHSSRARTMRPAMFWKRADQVSLADGVPLAHAERSEKSGFKLSSADEVASSVRLRKVRTKTLVQPRIGEGSTPPGATRWLAPDPMEIVNLQLEIYGVLTIAVTIDTAAAGFTDIPYYFVALQGSVGNARGSQAPRFLGDRITNLAQGHFTYTLTTPPISISRSEDQAPEQIEQGIRREYLSAARRHLHVAWIGIQMGGDEQHSDEVEDGIR